VTIAFLILIGMCILGVRESWAAEIAPVRERDPNPATSPRLAVARLTLADPEATAAAGVTPSEVAEFLAAQLATVIAENAPRSHGFNARELDELGQLLNAMGAGTHALTGGDAAQIGALIERQRASRGVSVVQLEGIAAALTEFYRARGLPLALAYVPAQMVASDEVIFAVALGNLESIDVQGESHYAQGLLARAFEEQLGRPVQRAAIESALYRVNQLPGLETRATFRAGSAAGSSRLELTALEERRLDGELRIDNHGTDATGNERLVMRGAWFNPSAAGDVLTGELLGALNPNNTLYGGLGYERPLGELATRVRAQASVDDFNWDAGGVRLDGRATVAALGMRHEISQSRRHADGVDAMLTGQKLELARRSGGRLVDQDLMMLGLGYDTFDRFDAHTLSTMVRAELDAGRILDGDLAGQSDTFVRLGVAASAWRLFDLIGFDAPQRLSASVRGQWASTALPGTLQLALGGPAGVRAFDSGFASVDDGAVATFALRLRDWDVSYGDLTLFADAGYGTQVRGFGDDAWVGLVSVGAGWLVDVSPHWNAELRGSVPLTAKGSPDVNDQGFNLFWMLRYVP
jgi:hemolysin activation/secretion protein